MSAEITPAVERTMQQINAMLGDDEPKFLPSHARSVLSAALRVEGMAPFFDPATVEPGRSKVMAAWNAAGLDAEVLMSEAEEIAAIRAEALRTALLGADS